MNITEQIGLEMGDEITSFLNKTPEVQVYANSSTDTYQWRDGRFENTCDVWENQDYKSRGILKIMLYKHLKSKGDF